MTERRAPIERALEGAMAAPNKVDDALRNGYWAWKLARDGDGPNTMFPDEIRAALADAGLAIVPVEPTALEAHLTAACAEAELAVVSIEPTQKMIKAALPADMYEGPVDDAGEAALTQAEEIIRTMWQAMLRTAQEPTDERT